MVILKQITMKSGFFRMIFAGVNIESGQKNRPFAEAFSSP